MSDNWEKLFWKSQRADKSLLTDVFISLMNWQCLLSGISVSHSYWLIAIPSLSRSSHERRPQQMVMSTDGRILDDVYKARRSYDSHQQAGVKWRRPGLAVGHRLGCNWQRCHFNLHTLIITTYSTPDQAIYTTNAWLQIGGHMWMREKEREWEAFSHLCHYNWSGPHAFTCCRLRVWQPLCELGRAGIAAILQMRLVQDHTAILDPLPGRACGILLKGINRIESLPCRYWSVKTFCMFRTATVLSSHYFK